MIQYNPGPGLYLWAMWPLFTELAQVCGTTLVIIHQSVIHSCDLCAKIDWKRKTGKGSGRGRAC